MRKALFLLAGLAVSVVPSGLAAQDVLRAGERADVPPPAEAVQTLAQDPGAFEFRRAWKGKVRRIVARREAVGPLLGPAYTADEMAAAGGSVTGTRFFPVLLVEYTDVLPPHPATDYRDRLFGGSGSGFVSATDFYGEISRGLFTVDGDVTEWLPVPGSSDFYEDGPTRFGQLWPFLRDALDAADGSMDFGAYDNDGPDGIPNSGDDDGYVDVAAFIYATVPGSCGGDGIWPHRWQYSSARGNPTYGGDGVSEPYPTDDPAAGGGTILVDDYIVQSGVQCDGSTLMGVGTITHELGHAIDLPDLYDTNGGSGGSYSEGIGHWGLMGSGSWNRPDSPAHMGAWSKMMMGWVDVTTVTTSGPRQLEPVQTSGAVLRVDVPGRDEYFLLANRRAVGSDQWLHAPGLLIWHIDPDRAGLLSEVGNGVNVDPSRKGVDLEEADGEDDLDAARNRGDAGDPYGGSATEFTVLTYPSSHGYVAGSCNVGLRNIAAGPGSSMTFDVAPEERYRIWGDVDGSHDVDPTDAEEAFEWALGYRGGNQENIGAADVDDDGDVDIRDALLIRSHLDGLPTGGFRVGDVEWVPCGASPSPPMDGGGPHRAPDAGTQE